MLAWKQAWNLFPCLHPCLGAEHTAPGNTIPHQLVVRHPPGPNTLQGQKLPRSPQPGEAYWVMAKARQTTQLSGQPYSTLPIKDLFSFSFSQGKERLVRYVMGVL